jgi:hypothetical protein
MLIKYYKMLLKEKRSGIYLLSFIYFVFLLGNLSALGISPAIEEYNFEPGLKGSINFIITDTKYGKEYSIYPEGDLSEYFHIDKEKIKRDDKINVKFELPYAIDRPGKHRVKIVVEEKRDEEIVGTGIGTTITLFAAIDIFVPYPGKYVEVLLTSPDVNVGELLTFNLDIINKGKEKVNITPIIEVYSQKNDEKLEVLNFKNRILESQKRIELKKIMNTTNFNPGKYKAIAVVEYGENKIAKSENEFRLGELIIYITDYTKKIILGGLKKFDIFIESGWNNEIEGVYADVLILDKSNKKLLEEFKTSSTNLIPWEEKVISGFFETSNFSEGFYDANISLIYYGGEVGKSSSEIVEIEFVKPSSKILLIISIISGGLFLLVIIFILIKKGFIKRDSINKIKKFLKEFIKNEKEKKNKKRN